MRDPRAPDGRSSATFDDAGELDRTQQAITTAGYRTDPHVCLPPPSTTIPVAHRQLLFFRPNRVSAPVRRSVPTQ
ncbi:hypothetical protein ACTWQF_21195 [Streptomyces sp. 8N114]|uniref:hypothetical protein n=1 Tax=Streptomyces sp. 8N114 TaxID=3457419 RepID=UPI003FD165EC